MTGARSVTKAVSPGASATVELVDCASVMSGFVASPSALAIAAPSTFETTTLWGRFCSVQDTLVGVEEFLVTITWTGMLCGLLPNSATRYECAVLPVLEIA